MEKQNKKFSRKTEAGKTGKPPGKSAASKKLTERELRAKVLENLAQIRFAKAGFSRW